MQGERLEVAEAAAHHDRHVPGARHQMHEPVLVDARNRLNAAIGYEDERPALLAVVQPA